MYYIFFAIGLASSSFCLIGLLTKRLNNPSQTQGFKAKNKLLKNPGGISEFYLRLPPGIRLQNEIVREQFAP